MPRAKKSEATKHEHSMGEHHMTKASGEHKSGKGTLMDGIVCGLRTKTMPPIVDGIYRGIPKYHDSSVAADVKKIHASPTDKALGSFGAGLFPEGKVGK